MGTYVFRPCFYKSVAGETQRGADRAGAEFRMGGGGLRDLRPGFGNNGKYATNYRADSLNAVL